ncbi:MAG TPA: ribosome silencing factor [Candidatus Ozemobacteraceae bacterium]|nr:ribosome silencing factor [Candidatus Ozemobacteraceae bacterium]
MTETTKKTPRAKITAKTATKPGAKKTAPAVKKTAATAGKAPVKRSRASTAKETGIIKPPRRKVAPKTRSEERVTSRRVAMHDLPDTLVQALKALAEKKVIDLAVLDVDGLVSYADYFVLGTGTSTPHIQAMADAVAHLLKVPGVKGARVEGDAQATWVLIDGGDFVVHLFQPDARRFYALDDLWGDAPRIPFEA